MKKTFRFFGFTLLAVACLGLFSCGSDGDDDDGIDTTPISLVAGKDKVIQGADTISSSNRFVAYGTKGTVHGWHVGDAKLMVNGNKTISISVYPQYYLYDDPICEWGCSMDYVKKNQKQGTLNAKSTNEILAYDNAGGATLLAYSFENDKLKSVAVFVSTNHTSTLASYLAERYLMIPIYEGSETYYGGMDGMDASSAKTAVLLQMYNTSTWYVFYASCTSSSTRSDQTVKETGTSLDLLRPFLAN